MPSQDIEHFVRALWRFFKCGVEMTRYVGWVAPWTFVAMSQLREFGLGELLRCPT